MTEITEALGQYLETEIDSQIVKNIPVNTKKNVTSKAYETKG